MLVLVNRGTVWQEQHKMWHINFHTYNDLGHMEVKYENSLQKHMFIVHKKTDVIQALHIYY